MSKLNLPALTTAIILATGPSCTPAIKSSDALTEMQNITQKRLMMVCIEGGPVTQCCHVSPDDTLGAQMASAGKKVNLHNQNEVNSFFTCQKDSRMATDDRGRTACLENTQASVAAKANTCSPGSIPQPVIDCDPETSQKTVKWGCYDWPYSG